MRAGRVLAGLTLMLSVCSVGGVPAAAQDVSPAPAAAPSTILRDVPYGTHERNTMDIYPAPDGGVAPIVITVHGGGWVRSDNSAKRVTAVAERLHELGFAVFNINYRLATEEEPGVPEQAFDIARAVWWVANHADDYGGDRANINLIGGSSGAQLSALAGQLVNAARPGLVRGVIPMSGIMDFVSFFQPPGLPRPGDDDHPGASTYLGCVPSTCTERQLMSSSPMWRITSACPRTLLINGDDEMVPESQAIDMHDALVAAGCDSTLVLIPGDDHGFGLFGQTEDEIVAFLTNR